MKRGRVDRPVAARIRVRIKDPTKPIEELDLLPTALREAGLIRREPRLTRWAADEPGVIEFTVMFVDGEAARTWERHPHVRKYLDEETRRLMRGRPRTVRERDYWVKVDDDRVCPCARSPWFMLQGPPIWRDEVLWCGECGLAVPNRRVPEPGAGGWAEVYRHIYEIWLASGVYEMWAERELSDLGSELNRAGRRLAREYARETGVPVYYELFFPEPGLHPVCVNCGRATREVEGWPTWRACQRCRLMFRHD